MSSTGKVWVAEVPRSLGINRRWDCSEIKMDNPIKVQLRKNKQLKKEKVFKKTVCLSFYTLEDKRAQASSERDPGKSHKQARHIACLMGISLLVRKLEEKIVLIQFIA